MRLIHKQFQHIGNHFPTHGGCTALDRLDAHDLEPRFPIGHALIVTHVENVSLLRRPDALIRNHFAGHRETGHGNMQVLCNRRERFHQHRLDAVRTELIEHRHTVTHGRRRFMLLIFIHNALQTHVDGIGIRRDNVILGCLEQLIEIRIDGIRHITNYELPCERHRFGHIHIIIAEVVRANRTIRTIQVHLPHQLLIVVRRNLPRQHRILRVIFRK